jgi:nitric oxide reductase NorE protein
VLLGGSILVVLATRAVAEARHGAASRLLAGAAACGLTFAAVKAVEYSTLLSDGTSLHSNDFSMLFFAVTGAHLLHVLVGTGALALLRRRVALGLPGPRDHALFESGACYWHMVDLLWLILFPLFYLVN